MDEIVLISIKHLLHIPNKIIKINNNFVILKTTNSRSILNIINYFKNSFKGIKSLEFKLWCKANLLLQTNFDLQNRGTKKYKITKIYNILNKIKTNTNVICLKSNSLDNVLNLENKLNI